MKKIKIWFQAWGKYFLCLLYLSLFGVQGVEVAWAQNIFQSYNKPMPIPEFSLEKLNDQMVYIRDYQGQVILLNFWATW